MNPNPLAALFLHELRGICETEQRLIDALPQIANASFLPELQALLELHLKRTESQIERLKTTFETLGASSLPCPATP